jgi:dehydrogenase/reductase SDR family member 4
MKNRKNASIVIVSSVAGLNPFPLIGAYSVSKTALLGLTKAIAPECAQMGIRVNCIAPGVIRTNFSRTLWENEEALNESNKNNLLGRIGESDECAGVASFLCSDDASYITGETIVIAGGYQSRL